MGNRPRHVSAGRLALVAGVLILPGCGSKASKLEFYAHEPGNFRALVADKPRQSTQTLPSPAGQLSMTSIESVDADQVRRLVVYTDFPRPIVEASDPNFLLDGGIKRMSGNGQWIVQNQTSIDLDSHPGREVRFTVNPTSVSGKGAGRARIYLIGSRLYQAIVVGPESKVSEEELDHFVKSFELLQKVPAITRAAPRLAAARDARPTVAAHAAPPPPAQAAPPPPDPADEPAPARGPDPPPAEVAPADPPPEPAPKEEPVAQAGDTEADTSKPAAVAITAKPTIRAIFEQPAPDGNLQERFRDLAPKRGVLVGMRVGYIDAFGGSKIGAIQPIYQVGKNYVEGQRFGADILLSTTVLARPGYAVGALKTQKGLLLDAFQVVFMKFKNGHLDPDKFYISDWLGDPRGGGPGIATGAGHLVVGVHGRSNGREINALGILVAE